MIEKLIAYNIEELEKKTVLSEAKQLYKSNIIDDQQWENARHIFASQLYSPSIFMRILLFIFSYMGMSTIIAPVGLLLNLGGGDAFRILAVILGIGLIVFTDLIMIRQKLHYKSGVTESGLYTGFGFLAFGILGFDTDSIYIYLSVGILISTFAAIRYLNLTAFVLLFLFSGWFLFRLLYDAGGWIQTAIPLILMVVYASLYFAIKKAESNTKSIIFENHFTIAKSITLIITYLSVNYFVVRELSVQLLELTIAQGDDIPLAYLFNFFTAFIPVAYIYWGLKSRSILLIRVGLVATALSVITFKYYYSLHQPILTVTIAGTMLIVISLLLLNYLKQMRNGYTREMIMKEKWNSQDIAAIIASQTLGGNRSTPDNETTFGGGSFGGGGAGNNW